VVNPHAERYFDKSHMDCEGRYWHEPILTDSMTSSRVTSSLGKVPLPPAPCKVSSSAF
jgi:hypothetical protein